MRQHSWCNRHTQDPPPSHTPLKKEPRKRPSYQDQSSERDKSPKNQIPIAAKKEKYHRLRRNASNIMVQSQHTGLATITHATQISTRCARAVEKDNNCHQTKTRWLHDAKSKNSADNDTIITTSQTFQRTMRVRAKSPTAYNVLSHAALSACSRPAPFFRSSPS